VRGAVRLVVHRDAEVDHIIAERRAGNSDDTSPPCNVRHGVAAHAHFLDVDGRCVDAGQDARLVVRLDAIAAAINDLAVVRADVHQRKGVRAAGLVRSGVRQGDDAAGLARDARVSRLLGQILPRHPHGVFRAAVDGDEAVILEQGQRRAARARVDGAGGRHVAVDVRARIAKRACTQGPIPQARGVHGQRDVHKADPPGGDGHGAGRESHRDALINIVGIAEGGAQVVGAFRSAGIRNQHRARLAVGGRHTVIAERQAARDGVPGIEQIVAERVGAEAVV